LAGIAAVMNSVTGLGYVFTEGGTKKRLLRMLVVNLYKLAFNKAKRVIFLNEDDYRLFERSGIVDSDKGIVIKSEGVNTEKFSGANVNRGRSDSLRYELDMTQGKHRVVVSMVCRLLWDKGVREFVEAARNLKTLYPDALFLLVGPIDTGNPAAVPERYLQGVQKEGIIRWLGERKDIPEIMYLSDVVVLPSYYREGIPMVLLEAMSTGKPVITTDSVGCRDVVEEGKNGLLVPVKDFRALAKAIEMLMIDRPLRIDMGKYGREKVLREFDEKIIVDRIMKLYEELLYQRSSLQSHKANATK